MKVWLAGLMVVLSLWVSGCRQPMRTVFAERLPDQKIQATGTESPVAGAGGCSPQLAARHPRYDLNRVAVSELEQLPNMTPVLARQVIAGRPYSAKRALVSRHVMTPEQYRRWKDYLVVHHPR